MLAISGFGIFLIFLVFLFIVASIASKAQKQENQKHARATLDALRDALHAQASQQPASAPEGATPPPIPAEYRRPGTARRQARKPRTPSPAVPKQAAASNSPTAPMPGSANLTPKPGKPAARVTAGQLRRQFILMELFSPPVALRDDSALSSSHGSF